MNKKANNSWIKQSLKGHSWLGIMAGVILYFICLSGSLVVFFEEFERWEQPHVTESEDYNSVQIETAVNNLLNQVEPLPEKLYVVLPTKAVPRMHVSADGNEWFVNSNGDLVDAVNEGWTHMLKNLHIYLHLPQTFGMIVVGIFGALLCGLIISGLLAHPRLFKDAFVFRPKANQRLKQTDIHNRLSVWGTPFYLMIGLTGAFIGLVSVLIALVAPAYFDGDRSAVVDAVYGADPIVKTLPQSIDYQAALTELKSHSPQATPIYFVIHKINQQGQFFEIAATLPQRLVYSELYRFNSDGSLINYQGLSDGPVGRQAAYSVYRLHFGHFGSNAIKILYALMGLALTVICVSGINIWLAKRKFTSYINHVWVAIVWGTPLALVASFLITHLLNRHISLTYMASFWISISSLIVVSVYLKNETKTKRLLKIQTAVFLAATLIFYYVNFSGFAPNPAALMVNTGLLMVLMIYLIDWLILNKKFKPFLYSLDHFGNAKNNVLKQHSSINTQVKGSKNIAVN